MHRLPILSLLTAALAAWVAGCARAPLRRAPAAEASPWAARKLAPDDYPDFADDLPRASLLLALRRSQDYLKTLPEDRLFRFGDTEYSAAALADGLRRFQDVLSRSSDTAALDAAVRAGFDVYESTGLDAAGKVVFSAYYEPVFPASRRRTAEFRYPLYARPRDLVDVDLGDFDARLSGETLAGRLDGDKLVPYFDREAIDDDGALAGKGLELAWLSDAFDRLDLHIEGSGILQFRDGSRARAQFDGSNDLPYRSVGRILVESGAIPKDAASHERVREYFRDHPDASRWVIARDPRYSFFRLEALSDDSGPQGTIEQPLTAGRSIAVDERLFPLGALAFITLPAPLTDAQGRLLALAPTSRFVLAQDTGGAIQGPGRVDLFVGSGDAAKAVATRLWNEGRLYFLLPKLPPFQR